jgi:hypothetical protein
VFNFFEGEDVESESAPVVVSPFNLIRVWSDLLWWGRR